MSLVIASYLDEDPRRLDSLGCLLYSLRAQTYAHWEAVVIHDGPWQRKVGDPAALKFLCQDPRVRLIETPERRGQFGHPWRSYGMGLARGVYLGLSNDDNYYAPVYFEWMLHQLLKEKARFVYCDMLHSHQQWRLFQTRPRKSRLDLGGWLAEAALARSTPWRDMGFSGDGTYINDLVARAKTTVKVPAALFVHN